MKIITPFKKNTQETKVKKSLLQNLTSKKAIVIGALVFALVTGSIAALSLGNITENALAATIFGATPPPASPSTDKSDGPTVFRSTSVPNTQPSNQGILDDISMPNGIDYDQSTGIACVDNRLIGSQTNPKLEILGKGKSNQVIATASKSNKQSCPGEQTRFAISTTPSKIATMRIKATSAQTTKPSSSTQPYPKGGTSVKVDNSKIKAVKDCLNNMKTIVYPNGSHRVYQLKSEVKKDGKMYITLNDSGCVYTLAKAHSDFYGYKGKVGSSDHIKCMRAQNGCGSPKVLVITTDKKGNKVAYIDMTNMKTALKEYK